MAAATAVVLRAGAAGVDDREGRAPSRLLRQARVVGLRAGAPARGDLLRARRRRERTGASGSARRGLAQPALIDSIRKGETAEDVKKRLGKPAEERWSVRTRRVRQDTRECGDDDPRDRAGGRGPLRPAERHSSFLQRGPGRQDLRVRGLRARRPAESRARPSRHGQPALQPGSGAGEGRERQRRRRRRPTGGAPRTGPCSCRWISARLAR